MSDTPLSMEELADSLARHGLPLLRSSDGAVGPDMEPSALITALVARQDGRLAEALIAMFLRYPSYAALVPALVDSLPAEAAHRLQHLYTAAVYLPRLWRGQLMLYLGEFELLPNLFGASVWGLPARESHHGEAGLRDLATHMQRESGENWLSSYESAIQLLLMLLRQEGSRAA